MPKRTKILIQWLVGAILLFDLALAGVNWQLAVAPHAAKSDLILLKKQHALLAADVARALEIRKDIPADSKQCDKFFQQNLAPSASGYSSLVTNLDALASAAGLHSNGVNFRQSAPDKRGVVTVEITTTVNGDYPSVVRFINGLQHSDTFYVLDGLSLGADTAGQLKLDLQLRTYFRS